MAVRVGTLSHADPESSQGDEHATSRGGAGRRAGGNGPPSGGSAGHGHAVLQRALSCVSAIRARRGVQFSRRGRHGVRGHVPLREGHPRRRRWSSASASARTSGCPACSTRACRAASATIRSPACRSPPCGCTRNRLWRSVEDGGGGPPQPPPSFTTLHHPPPTFPEGVSMRAGLTLGVMVLLATPAAAQWLGQPVWNSPKGGTGLPISGGYALPNAEFGKGNAWGGRAALGLGTLTVTAGATTWKPDAAAESFTSIGGNADFC